MAANKYTIKIVSYGTIVIENKTGKIVRCFAIESEAWDFLYYKEKNNDK